DGKVRSGAAALYAAGVAVAGGGKVHDLAAKRLDVAQQLDGLIVPQLADLAVEAEPAVRAYQETVTGVGISG
ncbi:MAG: hypothetical protein Q8R78_01230, partial [Candidatus Omnitrophota bacterium]|nr:hypothetical protein [Candidatus Omnitrophota bacterium]